jgi:hypothetical protein
MGFFTETVLGQLSNADKELVNKTKASVSNGYLSYINNREELYRRFSLNSTTLAMLSGPKKREQRRAIRDKGILEYLRYNTQAEDFLREDHYLRSIGWANIKELHDKLQLLSRTSRVSEQNKKVVTTANLSASSTLNERDFLAIFNTTVYDVIIDALKAVDNEKLNATEIGRELVKRLALASSSASVSNLGGFRAFVEKQIKTDGSFRAYLHAFEVEENLRAWRDACDRRDKELAEKQAQDEAAKRKKAQEAAEAARIADQHLTKFFATEGGYLSIKPTLSKGFIDPTMLMQAINNFKSAFSNCRGFIYLGTDEHSQVGAMRDFRTMDWRMIAIIKSLVLRERCGEFTPSFVSMDGTVPRDVQRLFVSALNADGRTELSFAGGGYQPSATDNRVAAALGQKHMHLYTGNPAELWTEVVNFHERARARSETQRKFAEFVLTPP